MGAIDTAFKAAFRDYNTDGVSTSGVKQPAKSDCRALGATIETFFDAPYTINYNAATAPTSLPTGAIERLIGKDADTYQMLVIDAFGGRPALRLRRANGTGAAPTAIASGDSLGEIAFTGYYTSGGAAYATLAGQFRAEATQGWTSTALGARLVAQTTPNNSATPVDAIWIGQDQSVLARGPVGYQTGVTSGGAVTQATNKSTGVTLNKVTGQITLSATGTTSYAALNSFVLTNSFIAATDVLVVSHISGGTLGAYWFGTQCAAGAARVSVFSYTNLAEAIVIQFAVIKGAIT